MIHFLVTRVEMFSLFAVGILLGLGSMCVDLAAVAEPQPIQLPEQPRHRHITAYEWEQWAIIDARLDRERQQKLSNSLTHTN